MIAGARQPAVLRRRLLPRPRDVWPNAVLVVMCAGYFLVLLDVTIVNVALPQIGAGLHAGVSGLQWVVDGYALALASLMLAGGTIGDLRGHRRIVLWGLVIFGIGSLACGSRPGSGRWWRRGRPRAWAPRCCCRGPSRSSARRSRSAARRPARSACGPRSGAWRSP